MPVAVSGGRAAMRKGSRADLAGDGHGRVRCRRLPTAGLTRRRPRRASSTRSRARPVCRTAFDEAAPGRKNPYACDWKEQASRPSSDQVSELTAGRLSVYLRCLNTLDAAGVKTISSKALAEQFHLNAAQIRKDLAYFGEFGVRGVGYYVKELKRHLRTILGLDRTVRVAILGAGQSRPGAGRLSRVPAGRLRDRRALRHASGTRSAAVARRRAHLRHQRFPQAREAGAHRHRRRGRAGRFGADVS